MTKKLKKPKNFRFVKVRCCETCLYLITKDGFSFCKRDKDNIGFDAANREFLYYVCDYFKYFD